MFVNTGLDILGTISSVGAIIAQVQIAYLLIEDIDEAYLRHEKLDSELTKLQEEEAVLRRKLYKEELAENQYWNAQRELDQIGHKITLLLQSTQINRSSMED